MKTSLTLRIFCARGYFEANWQEKERSSASFLGLKLAKFDGEFQFEERPHYLHKLTIL